VNWKEMGSDRGLCHVTIQEFDYRY